MKTIKILRVLTVVLLLSIVFLIAVNNQEQIITKFYDNEVVLQEDYVSDLQKGLVAYFTEPVTLVENENVKVSIYKLVPDVDFTSHLFFVVENNDSNELEISTSTQIDEGKLQNDIALAAMVPTYREICTEYVYQNSILQGVNQVENPESYDSYILRNLEFFTTSVNYKYKQVYKVPVYNTVKRMNIQELLFSIRVYAEDLKKVLVETSDILSLYTNDELVERESQKMNEVERHEVMSFDNVMQENIQLEDSSYQLYNNQLLLVESDMETQRIIYSPVKRAHYIMGYFVGGASIYLLEEIPYEEVLEPDMYKKYAKLIVMDMDGTNASTLIDQMECDWFKLPSIYIYHNVLYLFDSDFISAYLLNKLQRPIAIVEREDSIYANVISDSLEKYDPITEMSVYYGLPFWKERFGYHIATGESGEVRTDKNGEWDALTYFNEDTGREEEFLGKNLQAVSTRYIVFSVGESTSQKAYVYDLVLNQLETILQLPNGDRNCQAISITEEGIYFQKYQEEVDKKARLFLYKFSNKEVEKQ